MCLTVEIKKEDIVFAGRMNADSGERLDMKEPLESLLVNKKENEAAVIIGGMVLDIHATPSIHPAPRTTTPGKVHYAAGGVARNIAECVSKLGTKPFMISALGSDMSGNMLLEYWKSVGLSTQGIRMGHEIETPVVCIVFDTEGEPAAGVASVESLERYLTPQWIQQFKSNISSAPIVMVDANLSQSALEASCQLAAEVGTPVWFEPVSVAKSRRIVSVAKYVTFASPNEDELIAMANALSDKDIFFPIQKDGIPVTSLFQQLKSAIWVLLEKGIKVVILTLGSKGVLLCSKHHLNFQNIGPNRTIKSHNIGQKLHEIINQVCPSDRLFSGLKESSRSSPFVVHFPAVLSSSVVRLTGAGDCLVGGSIASFCVGLDLMQSIAVGIAAAKATVEVEANVPTEYSLEQITADARTVYLGATVVFILQGCHLVEYVQSGPLLEEIAFPVFREEKAGEYSLIKFEDWGSRLVVLNEMISSGDVHTFWGNSLVNHLLPNFMKVQAASSKRNLCRIHAPWPGGTSAIESFNSIAFGAPCAGSYDSNESFKTGEVTCTFV
ncbi:pseudouridine kinase [Tanacetum coccineum]